MWHILKAKVQLPDYVGEVISRVWILVYLWFTIQGQCVVVIPEALTCTSTIIMNIINHWRKYFYLELPTRPAQKCQPFGTCPRPPPAFRPYCCKGSLKLLFIFVHDWTMDYHLMLPDWGICQHTWWCSQSEENYFVSDTLDRTFLQANIDK